jgi:hypothetical protein
MSGCGQFLLVMVITVKSYNDGLLWSNTISSAIALARSPVAFFTGTLWTSIEKGHPLGHVLVDAYIKDIRGIAGFWS